MLCNHKYKHGFALMNLYTNGRTTDSSKWRTGEGIFPSRKVKTVPVKKCIHCGKSYMVSGD